MKTYWHAILIWTMLVLSPISLVIPVAGAMSERREELRVLGEKTREKERLTRELERELNQAREETAPHRAFVEAWSGHTLHWEPGRFFQRLDQLAFGLGLATGNKGTTQQGGGSQGPRTVLVTVNLNGEYASMIRFMKQFTTEFPLVRSDLIRLQMGPGSSIELHFQCTLPQS